MLKRLLTHREMILAGALLLSIAIGVTVRRYRAGEAQKNVPRNAPETARKAP